MKKSVPILLLIVLFAAGAWYFFTQKPHEVHELPPPDVALVVPAVEQQPEPVDDYSSYVEPEPEIVPEPLPPLNESDTEVTQALAEAVGTEQLTQYLVKNQVISRLVATIDALSSRQVPALINPVKPAGGKFVAEPEADGFVMSEKNFARYDGYVTLLENMDSGALLALYQRYYPLIQQAWEENGGEGPFSERLVEVIDLLLETPDVTGPIYLTRPEAVYLFEDPELESLTAGQKILLRMGRANAAVVKQKLRELRVELNS